nr:MAG: RNA-dependent RNA polymerase [Riboviria sp.]
MPQVNNSWYIDKYGRLPAMTSDSIDNVFADGRATHNLPLISRRAQEVLPGLSSFNPALLTFQRKFRDAMNETLKPDLDENLFSRSGYHQNMDSFCTVSGYGATPISAVPVDNAEYIRSLGLLDSYTQDQKEISNEVWDLIFRDYKFSNLKVPKKSQSGPRRRTIDHIWKKEYAEWMLEADNFENMLNAASKGDWLSLANEFEIAFLMYLQKRGQVDSIDKVRKVFTLDSVTGPNARSPKEIVADKKVVIDGVEYPDFSAMRMRTIHAGPWVLNWFLQIVATGHMQAMFINYPATWHVNTAEEIKNVVDGTYIFCGDVSNYDRSMKRDAIFGPHEVAKKYWDERIVNCSQYLYQSAYYSRPLGFEDKRGSFVRDFRDFRNEQVFCGNRSGHAWTSLIAKGNKVVETLWIFHVLGYEVKGKVASWLKGEMPCGVVNNGDDEIIWFKNKNDLARFKEIRKSHPELIYVVEAEAGQVYSGMVLTIRDDEPLVYYPVQRLNVTFQKIYIPERPIGGDMRPYWWVGVLERVNARNDHPVGHIAWELHDKFYHDHISPEIGPLLSLLSNASLSSPLNMLALTANDKAVLEDKDRIHYRVKDGEVSEEVLNAVISSLEWQKFEGFVFNYYSGTIH